MKNELNDQLKNLYIFLFGQFVSQFGSKLTSYGLVLWAYKQSGSVLSTALLYTCYLIPEVSLNFIAGGISDKWNKKKIMLTSDVIAAFFSCVVLGLIITGNMKLGYLYIINFMLGIMDAFQAPASEVAISCMISKENYIKTSGIQSLFNAFITIFYPIVATAIYAFSGMKLIIIIDLATFVFAFITLAFIVKIPHNISSVSVDETVWQKCCGGIKYIRQEKSIMMLIAFMAFVNLIAAAYNTNLAPMVLARTENNDFQLGIVSGTIGVAGLIGSMFTTKVENIKKRVPLIINIMAFSFLVCNGLLGIGRNYYTWTFAVFVGNILIPVFSANVAYIMRTKIPIEMQGRVFSARNTLQYIAIPVGNIAGSLLSDDIFGPFMKSNLNIKIPFEFLVGSGNGSGIALCFVFITIIGVLGCFFFKKNQYLLMLDD